MDLENMVKRTPINEAKHGEKDYINGTTYAVILGGGKGSRMYSLTRRRSKPAIPFTTFRFGDFPLSNCEASKIDFVDVYTQFEKDSFEKHIASGKPWGYDEFSLGVYSPSERKEGFTKFKGTADAVRGNLRRIKDKDYEDNPLDAVIILSADQIYSENYRTAINDHLKNESDLTVYTQPVSKEDAPSFGLMKVNNVGRITDFVEKPKEESILKDFELSDEAKKRFNLVDEKGNVLEEPTYLGSMGIYVFDPKKLFSELEQGGNDFGGDIIPRMVSDDNSEVKAYVFQGYWEDVGRLDKLIEANFYAIKNPLEIFTPHLKTNGRQVPPSVGGWNDSIVAPGSIVHPGANVEHSVLGYQTLVEDGASIINSVLHGGDRHVRKRDGDFLNKHYSFIKKNVELENVLLDRNVYIDEGVELKGTTRNPDKVRKAISDAMAQKIEENFADALEKGKVEKSDKEFYMKFAKENGDEEDQDSLGGWNLTEKGYIVIGKPPYGFENVLPKNFKI